MLIRVFLTLGSLRIQGEFTVQIRPDPSTNHPRTPSERNARIELLKGIPYIFHSLIMYTFVPMIRL